MISYKLCGVRKLNISTDHKPLSTKILTLRKKEGNNAHVFYKPGEENKVTNALSRQYVIALEDTPDSYVANIHRRDSSLIRKIQQTNRSIVLGTKSQLKTQTSHL